MWLSDFPSVSSTYLSPLSLSPTRGSQKPRGVISAIRLYSRAKTFSQYLWGMKEGESVRLIWAGWEEGFEDDLSTADGVWRDVGGLAPPLRLLSCQSKGFKGTVHQKKWKSVARVIPYAYVCNFSVESKRNSMLQK